MCDRIALASSRNGKLNSARTLLSPGALSKVGLSTNEGPAGPFFVARCGAIMERHLYRFRTADRLLGKDATETKEAVPGEIEKSDIYFVPPEQLNDSLAQTL